jgi:predicted acyltransferase
VSSGVSNVERLRCLDVFRGMTVAGMILVSTPGDPDSVYAPLRHARWDGWTVTDLIFPFFLFIVGVSMSLSNGRDADTEMGCARYRRVLTRGALLFLIGLTPSILRFDFDAILDLGVLERIALTYVVAAAVVINLSSRHQYVLAAKCLIGYWAVLTLVPAPGSESNVLTQQGNLGSYIDRNILGLPHLDSEGFLSTGPAVIMVLIGYWTGEGIRSKAGASHTTVVLLFAGVVCLASQQLPRLRRVRGARVVAPGVVHVQTAMVRDGLDCPPEIEDISAPYWPGSAVTLAAHPTGST